jgi:hypothetical protein
MKFFVGSMCILLLAATAQAEPAFRAVVAAKTPAPVKGKAPAATPAPKKANWTPKVCAKHTDCNAKTEFCSIDHKKNTKFCLSCHKCSPNVALGKKCPAHCETAVGSHCKTHKECEGGGKKEHQVRVSCCGSKGC